MVSFVKISKDITMDVSIDTPMDISMDKSMDTPLDICMDMPMDFCRDRSTLVLIIVSPPRQNESGGSRFSSLMWPCEGPVGANK